MENMDIKPGAAKKVWKSPRLIEYGKVSALTQAGSGGPSESEGGSQSGMTCTTAFKTHQLCPAT